MTSLPLLANGNRIFAPILTLALALLLQPALTWGQETATTDKKEFQLESKVFEQPQLIHAGNTILNNPAFCSHPSPAIYDVDGDGQAELIIGSLSGQMYVCENTNESDNGDPIWSKQAPLKNATGKPIRVSNW